MRTILFVALLGLFTNCHSSTTPPPAQNGTASASFQGDPMPDYSRFKTPNLQEAGLDEKFSAYAKAYFASGCFWCTEEVYQRVKGVQAVYSGYVGGEEEHPTYEQVGRATTGHAEAVVVYYDAEVVSYEQLVEFFYASHDPTQVDRQGPDVGPQYRSGIFYLNESQREIAAAYQQKLEDSGKYEKSIATEITAAGPFYLAEAYHQDYYPQHPDNPYVQRVSKPKVEKFTKAYSAFLKPDYQ